jgi:hypothetical protein
LATVGYRKCDAASFRDDLELAAVFGSGGLFKHVSLLVAPDLWKSKIGEFEDFDDPLKGNVLGEYGKFHSYLVRPISAGRIRLPDEYRL